MIIMATAQKSHTELNPVQISLLRLFSRPMSESETLELKKIMVNYYDDQLSEELTKIIAEKRYTQKDFDDMLNANS
jgi:hypothetical protein